MRTEGSTFVLPSIKHAILIVEVNLEYMRAMDSIGRGKLKLFLARVSRGLVSLKLLYSAYLRRFAYASQSPNFRVPS